MAENYTDKVKGFTPVQWAFGSDITQWHKEADLLEVNKQNVLSSFKFWQLQKNCERAEEIHREELSQQRIVRLKNAASRPAAAYAIGDWVCVWQHSPVRQRRKEGDHEPQFFGPGRVAMIEPAVIKGGKSSVLWVLMGTAVWRCAPEQLRHATEQEIVMKTIKLGDQIALPITDLIAKLRATVDITKEPCFHPEQDRLPKAPSEQTVMPEEETRKDPEERKRTLQEDVSKWNQWESINKARRLEGLAPLTSLPTSLSSDSWEFFESNGKLVRHYKTPRWTLFVPTECNNCPVELRHILGRCSTSWWDGQTGSKFKDNWKKSKDPSQAFACEWTGKTEFKLSKNAKRKMPEQFDMTTPSDVEKEETTLQKESFLVESKVDSSGPIERHLVEPMCEADEVERTE